MEYMTMLELWLFELGRMEGGMNVDTPMKNSTQGMAVQTIFSIRANYVMILISVLQT